MSKFGFVRLKILVGFCKQVCFKKIPKSISDDLLNRYSSIGSRLNRLYKLLFSKGFHEDLTELGFKHIYDHLMLVQQKRNEFIHGNPHAITQSIIDATVYNLQESQEAMILLYNKRCTNIPSP